MWTSDTGRGLALAAIAVYLSSCGSAPQQAWTPDLPDEPGFYALTQGADEDDYQRLDGDREWEIEHWSERSDLHQSTQFVIYDPLIARDPAPLTDKVRLQKIAWVRSEIGESGPIKPVAGSKWALADVPELTVPITVRPLEGRPDAAYVVASRRLEPGLYSLQLRSAGMAKHARLGILWSSVDKSEYSGSHCVDRYLDASHPYQLCAQQSLGGGLRIYLVDPESTTLGGRPTLVVKGVVANPTSQHRPVPALEASILSASGATLKHWVFESPRQELGPGESASFRTDMPDPPLQTSKVTVRLAERASAGIQPD